MKFGKIELSDWTPRNVSEYQDPDLIRFIRPHTMGVVLYMSKHNMIEHVRFYSQLSDLQTIFRNLTLAMNINWDINFAKEYVDAFLIKMNNLRAFL